MPNKLNLHFRNPVTGQSHTIEGEVVKKMTKDNPQSISELRNNPQDGKVDLFVNAEKASRWSGAKGEAFHLQIDASNLTEEQVKDLAAAVRSGEDGSVSLGEGRSYNTVSLMTDLWMERADVLGAEGHLPEVSLNGSEENPVFLSDDGVFSTSTTAPAGPAEAAQGLYAAAEAGDKLAEGENIFTRNGVSLETKEKTLSNINELLAQAPTMEPNEAAQVRSSAASVLTEMLSSLDSQGAEGALQREAFGALQGLVENETIGGLRESMVFNAVRIQAGLPDDLHDAVGEMRASIAPATPPYDKWFANGKNELNISFAAGHGEGFYEGMTELLTDKGYEIVDDGNRSSWNEKPRHFQLKKMVNGEEKIVNIHMRDFDNDSFNDIDNDDMDMIVYQGHSNLGNNTRKSVENAPDATGDGKLIFLGLCSGKDNLDRVRKAFPEAQTMTTFNSSYFNTKPMPGGDRQFTGGEDARALMSIIDGALEQQPWSEINESIRDNAVGWNHKDKTLGNYLSPIELKMGSRFRDLDNDGSAMALDRHFNIDTLEVRAGAHGSLTPRDSNNPDGQKLNGELPHLAAAFANTIDLYNPTYDKFSHKGRIMADGYYKGTENDPIVKFDTTVNDGEKVYTMQVNEQYAHIGEEALRAITMVEYNRHLASTEAEYPVKDPVKRELVGMLTAAASLTYDAGYRDAAVFQALVDHYDLPKDLKWRDAGRLIDDEHHDYTGSASMADKWMDKMSPETIQALRDKFGS